jgi:hypothetical protein
MYLDLTEDLAIEMFQYGLQDSARDGPGLVGNRVATGFISPRVNITQFHALPDFCSVPQQTPDDHFSPYRLRARSLSHTDFEMAGSKPMGNPCCHLSSPSD